MAKKPKPEKPGSSVRQDIAISQWPIDKIKPDAGNARTHSPEQVTQIAASIREFGFTNPLLVRGDGRLIAGHGRLLAARRLGMTTVPAIALDHLSDAQAKALLLADNKLAENAGWDEELLAAALKGLQAEGYDLSLTGFDDDEINALILDATKGETDPDDVPEMWAHPVSRTGDLWILGQHRLLCGDSTSAEDVKRLLGGVEPNLMVTDQPYGVEYDPTWRDNAGGKFGDGKTKMRGKVQNDDRADWSEAWKLFPGDVAYVWHASLFSPEVITSLESSGFLRRSNIIWNKQHFTLSRGHYHWQHEPCWYVVRKSATGNWQGDRKQTTVWDIANLNPAGGSNDDGKTSHGTQKPVECMRRPMLNNSAPGQAVYDPFMGSGTTLIAAEQERRVCFGMDIDPLYVDLAVRRWQDFTGKEARLDGDKRSFGEIVSDRAVTQDGGPSQKVKIIKTSKARGKSKAA